MATLDRLLLFAAAEDAARLALDDGTLSPEEVDAVRFAARANLTALRAERDRKGRAEARRATPERERERKPERATAPASRPTTDDEEIPF